MHQKRWVVWLLVVVRGYNVDNCACAAWLAVGEHLAILGPWHISHFPKDRLHLRCISVGVAYSPGSPEHGLLYVGHVFIQFHW